jgi:hypothetical protein
MGWGLDQELGDPAIGQTKRVVIEYAFDSVPAECDVRQGEAFTIPRQEDFADKGQKQ